VDFLKHFRLLIDPAGQQLVEAGMFTPIAMVVEPSRDINLSLPAVAQVATCCQSVQDAICGKDSFRDVLSSKFPDVFNPSKILPVATHGVEHFVVTSGPPVASKFRLLDPEKLAAAKAEFDKMEAEGIIHRSTSPWASPLHLVPKEDGSWRPCGDFCHLNLVTVLDSYHLPNMMDFTSKMAGKIDLRKGYH
jgi:hypothetical protein